MPRLVFVGTGDACDPSLPNTSILYQGARNILIDCGSSVPQAFWKWTSNPELLDGIYLTHHHADHALGLPAMLLWMRVLGRQKPLQLWGGPGSEQWIPQLMEMGYPGAFQAKKCFPIEIASIPPGCPVNWGPLRLVTAKTQHSLANYAVRIEESNSAIAFSGDGAPSPACRDLYRGASVLVHECQSQAGVNPSHANAVQLLSMAEELRLPILCLVHLAADAAENSRVRGHVRACQDDAQRLGNTLVLIPSPGDQRVV